jgi:hypothetical protein
MTDEQFLKLAIEQSSLAAKRGEYPYGAVLVRRGEVLLRAQGTSRHMRNSYLFVRPANDSTKWFSRTLRFIRAVNRV